MDIKLILILGLIVLAYYQYSYPDSSQDKLDGTLGKAKTWIDGKNPLTPKTAPVNDSPCPDTYNPVCGNGITYNNICFAALADVLEVTQGECP